MSKVIMIICILLVESCLYAEVKGDTGTLSPSVDITSPINLSITNQPSIAISYSFFCAESENSSHYWTNGDGQNYSIINQGEFLCSLKEGFNRITIIVIDKNGDIGQDSILITRDTAPPTIQVAAIGMGESAEVFWTIIGDNLRTVRLWWQLNTDGWNEIDPTRPSLKLNDLKGTNNVYFKVQDALGNSMQTQEWIKTEADPPEFVIIPSPDNYIGGEPFKLDFYSGSYENLVVRIIGMNFTNVNGWIYPEKAISRGETMDVFIQGNDRYGNLFGPMIIPFRYPNIYNRNLTVHVKDENGTVVENATVKVIGKGKRFSDSDKDGIIITDKLYFGWYTFQISAEGYQDSYVEYNLSLNEESLTVVMKTPEKREKRTSLVPFAVLEILLLILILGIFYYIKKRNMVKDSL